MGLGVEVQVGRGAAMGRHHRRMSRLLEIIRCKLGTRWIVYEKKLAKGFSKWSADIVKKGG
jgi:hypothetical protein